MWVAAVGFSTQAVVRRPRAPLRARGATRCPQPPPQGQSGGGGRCEEALLARRPRRGGSAALRARTRARAAPAGQPAARRVALAACCSPAGRELDAQHGALRAAGAPGRPEPNAARGGAGRLQSPPKSRLWKVPRWPPAGAQRRAEGRPRARKGRVLRDRAVRLGSTGCSAGAGRPPWARRPEPAQLAERRIQRPVRADARRGGCDALSSWQSPTQPSPHGERIKPCLSLTQNS